MLYITLLIPDVFYCSNVSKVGIKMFMCCPKSTEFFNGCRYNSICCTLVYIHDKPKPAHLQQKTENTEFSSDTCCIRYITFTRDTHRKMWELSR